MDASRRELLGQLIGLATVSGIPPAEVKAIESVPPPLFLIVTVSQTFSDRGIKFIQAKMERFAAEHSLPPFLVMREGMDIIPMIDPRFSKE